MDGEGVCPEFRFRQRRERPSTEAIDYEIAQRLLQRDGRGTDPLAGLRIALQLFILIESDAVVLAVGNGVAAVLPRTQVVVQCFVEGPWFERARMSSDHRGQPVMQSLHVRRAGCRRLGGKLER